MLLISSEINRLPPGEIVKIHAHACAAYSSPIIHDLKFLMYRVAKKPGSFDLEPESERER